MGPPGIRQFHQLRQNAIKEVTGEEGDYFHNGRQVLDAVKDWHNVVRNVLRKSDTVTGQVLDLVDKKMLLGSVKARAKAEDICVALRQIATRTDAQSRVPMTEGIMKTLLEFEERAASVPNADQALVIPQHSKPHKSTVFDLTDMKTAHRSEYLKSALSAESADRQVSKSRDSDTSNEPSQQAERPLSSDSRPEPTPLHHARTGSQHQDTPSLPVIWDSTICDWYINHTTFKPCKPPSHPQDLQDPTTAEHVPGSPRDKIARGTQIH